jgi:hypothetical protein
MKPRREIVAAIAIAACPSASFSDSAITARILEGGAPSSASFELLSDYSGVIGCKVGPNQFYLLRESDRQTFLVDVERRTSARTPNLTSVPQESLEPINAELTRIKSSKRPEIPVAVVARPVANEAVPRSYREFMKSAEHAGFPTCSFPLTHLPSKVTFKGEQHERTVLVEISSTARSPAWIDFNKFSAEPADSILQRLRGADEETKQ